METNKWIRAQFLADGLRPFGADSVKTASRYTCPAAQLGKSESAEGSLRGCFGDDGATCSKSCGGLADKHQSWKTVVRMTISS